ncbi:MAG: hypothetical protein K8963_01180 [Proteobacteria bacterium]|nr:hypothetical protein [Pseudomonadota bacterium]
MLDLSPVAGQCFCSGLILNPDIAFSRQPKPAIAYKSDSSCARTRITIHLCAPARTTIHSLGQFGLITEKIL